LIYCKPKRLSEETFFGLLHCHQNSFAILAHKARIALNLATSTKKFVPVDNLKNILLKKYLYQNSFSEIL
jgi:hypothetical protein